MNKKKIASIIASVIMAGAFFMPVNAQTVYKGVDVYEYTNISNYQALKNTGTSVVIQKATQGIYHNDSLLQYRASTLRQYGFKVGYYHFANNSGMPVAEAQHFLSQIKGLKSDTILFLDIENEGAWTKSQAINYTNAFIKYVQAQGYKIGIYSGLSFYYEYLQDNIPNVPLWLASYGKQPLQFPSNISWQYTGTGHIAGITGYADLDYFNSNIFTGNTPSTNGTTVTTKVVIDFNVKNAQSELNRIMNAGLVVDGINGPKTQQAVAKFQSVMGITVDSIVGTRTNVALTQILDFIPCQYGSNNFATKYIQHRLGLYPDGRFGPQTRTSVMKYQKSHGLAFNGITYTSFWKCLFK